MPKVESAKWIEFLTKYPDAHILQTDPWGLLKNEFGWQSVHVITSEDPIQSKSGAQILFRRLPLGFSLAYIPKGPVGNRWDLLWPEIDSICKANRAIFLKVEPDIWEDNPASSDQEQKILGFFQSSHNIQPRRSLVVNLCGTEEQILARMKQKTRYNIRLAHRKGVVIRQTRDIDMFYQLMQETSERDTFGIHSKKYYQRALELFEPNGNCALFCAEFERQPLAGLMVFAQGNRAWYFYGASSNEHRYLMPTYLLQWEAMQWAKKLGCREYDLWGVPDETYESLESQFLKRNDDLWSVYRFKRGFGGELRRSIGALDRVYRPRFYQLYLWRIRQKSSSLL